MSEKAYNRSLIAMQNGLSVKNKLDIRELGIQFGCIRLIPLVQKALSLYRDRFLAALPASRRASADCTRPVFTAAAFYLCIKRHKLKVDKIKLIELCGTSEDEFNSVSTFMKDLCFDQFGITNEKADPKKVKGNRVEGSEEEAMQARPVYVAAVDLSWGMSYIQHQQSQQMVPDPVIVARSSMFYGQQHPYMALQQQQALQSQLGISSAGTSTGHSLQSDITLGSGGTVMFPNFGRSVASEG